jgi:hypothetical protein
MRPSSKLLIDSFVGANNVSLLAHTSDDGTTGWYQQFSGAGHVPLIESNVLSPTSGSTGVGGEFVFNKPTGTNTAFKIDLVGPITAIPNYMPLVSISGSATANTLDGYGVSVGRSTSKYDIFKEASGTLTWLTNSVAFGNEIIKNDINVVRLSRTNGNNLRLTVNGVLMQSASDSSSPLSGTYNGIYVDPTTAGGQGNTANVAYAVAYDSSTEIAVQLIGASVTRGYNGSNEATGAWFGSWAGRGPNGIQIRVRNDAVSGTNSSDVINGTNGSSGLATLVANAQGDGCQFVILGGDFGPNDAKTAVALSVTQHIANINTIITAYNAVGIVCVLDGGSWINLAGSINSGNAWNAGSNTLITAYEQAYKTLVNGRTIWAGDLAWNEFIQANQSYSYDGAHLTDAGYSVKWNRSYSAFKTTLANYTTAAPLPLDRSTTAQFLFQEGSGTSSLDRLGQTTMNFAGAPTWSSSTPSGTGNSIVLNGTSQCISAPVLAKGIYDATIAFWFNPSSDLPVNDGSTDRRLFYAGTGSSGHETAIDLYSAHSGSGGSGKLSLRVAINNSNAVIATSVNSFPFIHGINYRIAISSSGSYLRVYVNGAKIIETSSQWGAITSTATYQPTIGAYNGPAGAQQYLAGAISEPLFDNRCWTTAEALSDYLGNLRYASIQSKLSAPVPLGGGVNKFAWQEPNVLRNLNGVGYVHTFSVGYDNEVIHFGTSPDGKTITDLGPIIGGGAGGESGSCGRSSLWWGSAGQLRINYSNAISGGGLRHNTLNPATGAVLGTANTILAYNAVAGMNGVQNTKVLPHPAGGYVMLFESLNGTQWKMGKASSPNDTNGGTWTVDLYPITALTPSGSAIAGAGGPALRLLNPTTWVLFYTADWAPIGVPSFGMVATSPVGASASASAITWTVANDGQPIVSSSPLIVPSVDALQSQFFVDIEPVDGTNATDIHGSVVDNTTKMSVVYQVAYPGTLANLLNDGSGGTPDFTQSSPNVANGSGTFATGGAPTTTPQGVFGN